MVCMKMAHMGDKIETEVEIEGNRAFGPKIEAEVEIEVIRLRRFLQNPSPRWGAFLPSHNRKALLCAV